LTHFLKHLGLASQRVTEWERIGAMPDPERFKARHAAYAEKRLV